VIAACLTGGGNHHKTQCSLLCGYSLDAIGNGGGYYRICDQHSHVHLEDRI